MLGGIPTSLQGFSVYVDALKELGVVDIELPNIQFMTDTVSGSGIAGEIDMPIAGLTQGMQIKIKKRSPNMQFSTLLAPRTHNLTFRGKMLVEDSGHPLSKSKARNIRIVANVKPKGKNLGKGEVAKSMETEAEFEVISLLVFMDEIPTLHIDKFNNKFVVDGINYLDEDDFL